VSLSRASNDDDKQKPNLEQYKVKDQELVEWGTLNVLGKPAEPICTYYRVITGFHFTVLEDAGLI
jgi:hypothetical protein